MCSETTLWEDSCLGWPLAWAALIDDQQDIIADDSRDIW